MLGTKEFKNDILSNNLVMLVYNLIHHYFFFFRLLKYLSIHYGNNCCCTGNLLAFFDRIAQGWRAFVSFNIHLRSCYMGSVNRDEELHLECHTWDNCNEYLSIWSLKRDHVQYDRRVSHTKTSMAQLISSLLLIHPKKLTFAIRKDRKAFEDRGKITQIHFDCKVISGLPLTGSKNARILRSRPPRKDIFRHSSEIEPNSCFGDQWSYSRSLGNVGY